MAHPSDLTHEPIPMLDLTGEVEALWDELNAAIQRVLRSGRFIGGPEVEAFEAEVADFLGVKHAVSLNSGTDALVIGLEALGIGPGDEVITTAFSFFATSEAIMRVGATPVFVDIDPVTLNLDAALIEPAVTERTRAILPVHLFGLPADMERILDIAERHDLYVLEDCAQAFGARSTPLGGRRVGSLGDVGAFSFYPTKNLGAYGDGGLMTTDDAEVAALARSLRDHGARAGEKYVHDRLGYNSRLDALQAAILRVKLPHVDAWNAGRREVARMYDEALRPLGKLVLPPLDPDHVFHQYTVQVVRGTRFALGAVLDAEAVAHTHYYPVALPDQPTSLDSFGCERARHAAQRVASLPMAASIEGSTIPGVARALNKL